MNRKCEKCGHIPKNNYIYHKGIMYPLYIKLGKNGTRMRFQKSQYTDDMVYYRHGGDWEMGVTQKKNMSTLWRRRFYSYIPTHQYIHHVRLYKTSFKDWKKDNGGYA